MRGSISIVGVAISIISFITPTYADNQLEGRWESDRHHIIITIETTKEGIRVKRSGQNRWYEYLEYRENQFRDSQGNTYYLLSDNTLEWEDQSGKKHLRFKKSTDLESVRDEENQYRDDSDNNFGVGKDTKYIERNHVYSHHGNREIVATHSFNGRWINQTTGQLITVKSRNNTLRIKANRGGWETFYRKDGNTFIDGHGNRYDARKNELTYVSRRADFIMTFRR